MNYVRIVKLSNGFMLVPGHVSDNYHPIPYDKCFFVEGFDTCNLLPILETMFMDKGEYNETTK